MHLLPLVVVGLFTWNSIAAVEPSLSPFVDGEVVTFVGDSITHDGRWHRCIGDFYATRFPERRIVFINAGLAGDTAGGALGRLDDDVLRWKPSTAVVMLGMNDCGRDAYKPGTDGDAMVKGIRERALTTYQDNMGKLSARLHTAVKRVILTTPSPYEDTAQLAVANLPGANAALGRGGSLVATIAQAGGFPLVDFHGPMTALDQERQRQDPAFTLIGADRVHPGSPGHLVMAWLFLKSQGVSGLVSRTVINARTKDAKAENATISGTTFMDGEVAFTLAGRCLPFPITDDARPALAFTSIESDLDWEELVVSGLAEGSWQIEIDGKGIGNYSSAALATGVNLALVGKTPQYRQALKVQMLQEERRAVERRLRSVAMVQHKLFKPGEVDFADQAKVNAAIDQRLAGKPTPFFIKMYEECRNSWAEVPALRERVVAMTETIQQAAQPVPHRYRILRAP